MFILRNHLFDKHHDHDIVCLYVICSISRHLVNKLEIILYTFYMSCTILYYILSLCLHVLSMGLKDLK